MIRRKIRESKFVFDSVYLLHYSLHKISLNRRRSNIDPSQWLKNKKSNNKYKNDNRCFQYVITVRLNHQNIENNPERITKIKCFIISIIGKK